MVEFMSYPVLIRERLISLLRVDKSQGKVFGSKAASECWYKLSPAERLAYLHTLHIQFLEELKDLTDAMYELAVACKKRSKA